MKSLILFYGLCLFQTPQVIIGERVPLQTVENNWHVEFKKHKNQNQLECRELEEIQNTFVCITATKEVMNKYFIRASYYTENEEDKSNTIAGNDPELLRFSKSVSGHDLKSEDLKLFFNQAIANCEKSNHDKNICLNKEEQEFYNKFMLNNTSQNSLIVISYSLEEKNITREVLSHEVLHAHYFSNKKYNTFVKKFWDHKVTDADKIEISMLLMGNGYDTSNYELLINEFQAYLLEHNADKNILSDFVEKYQKNLKKQILKTIHKEDII